MSADGFVHLPVNHLHALRAVYPMEHRDPVDRMLAAQSELQRLLPLLTCDAAFLAFGIQTIW